MARDGLGWDEMEWGQTDKGGMGVDGVGLHGMALGCTRWDGSAQDMLPGCSWSGLVSVSGSYSVYVSVCI